MEELERVYEATLEAIRRGEPAAVVTVVEARGSTPRKAGAKMLVYADGRTVGTVGGGTLEAWVIEEALAVLAECPVAYVGLLGSRRRTRATFERARAMGVPNEFLARVHTPVGINIGAETPREIAVSILAKIIAVQRGQA